MIVQVLGPGCRRCEELATVTSEAVASLGIDAEVEKVTDYATMARLGVVSTPALAVDGRVVVAGHVPDAARVRTLLTSPA